MNYLQKFKQNFNLNSVDPIYFWKSEWEKFEPSSPHLYNVSLFYICFRFAILLYFIAGTIVSLTCTTEINLYFIYLTNWSFTIQLVYSAAYFFRLVWVWFKYRRIERRLFSSSVLQRLPWPEKILWILINLIGVVPYFVSLGFWIFLYDPEEVKKSRVCEQITNVFVHALNSPIALIDMMVMAVPIKLSHMIFPIGTGFVYSFFSGMYEVGQGAYSTTRDGNSSEYIYDILNWKRNPAMAALSSGMSILAAGLLHLTVAYGVYQLRLKLSVKCKGKRISIGGHLTRMDLSASDVMREDEFTKSFEDGIDNPVSISDETDRISQDDGKDYQTFTKT